MPSVEIDGDVYEFLRGQVRDFGENPSMVLRRLLNLPHPKPPVSPTIPPPPTTVAPPPPPPAADLSPLSRFLAEMRTTYRRTATDKFLAILAFALKDRPHGFEGVLQLGGRQRRYFARSREEIMSSGTSTHPKKAPGVDVWAMTNADTAQKRDMLKQALRVLGYSDDEIRAASDVL